MTPLLDLVNLDSTLCLEIRKNYINIYYRGGSIMKIEEKQELFNASIDRKYFDKDFAQKPSYPGILNSSADVNAWMVAIPFLKHQMDIWFGYHPKNEREFQQLMLRENNRGISAKGTDYFICDIEYANHTGRFDLVAVKWPSTPSCRKNNTNLRLAFIEMKYLDAALRSSKSEKGKINDDNPKKLAGLCKHVDDMNTFLSKSDNLENIKEEMKIVFNQKLDLGLINNQKAIESFSNDKPEFLLALSNHDPESTILRNELERLPECTNTEIKVATSNFMGYGLYSHGIYGLDEFLRKFEDRI